MENMLYENRLKFKNKLKNRERVYGGWVSFSHPSITEIFSQADFDFIAIDMEHSTISIEQAQRIISASQGNGTLCFPRPVSHSNDYIKPLLDSGADGLIIQMVNTPLELEQLIKYIKFPPIGDRSFGVNRAHNYGLSFNKYIKTWNNSSSLIIQVESVTAVNNIEKLLQYEQVDGVMIGPYDISGSLGVPGQTSHKLVTEATKIVIDACEKYGKSCGTQIEIASQKNVESLFCQGYTFCIMGSDLFILSNWVKDIRNIINNLN